MPVIEAFERGSVAFLVADYTRPNAIIAAELQKHNRAGVPMYLWYCAGRNVACRLARNPVYQSRNWSGGRRVV